MTTRLKGVYVSFENDIREDDAEYIINAIRMIKGIENVESIVSDANDWIIRSRINNELREKLYKIIKELD